MTRMRAAAELILPICVPMAAILTLLTAYGQTEAKAKYNEANVAFEQEEYEQALGEYERVRKELPNRPEPVYNAANARYKLENYEEAQGELEEALLDAYNANDDELASNTLFNLGNVLFQRGEYRAAVDQYREAIDQYREAIDQYKEVLRQKPGRQGSQAQPGAGVEQDRGGGGASSSSSNSNRSNRSRGRGTSPDLPTSPTTRATTSRRAPKETGRASERTPKGSSAATARSKSRRSSTGPAPTRSSRR